MTFVRFLDHSWRMWNMGSICTIYMHEDNNVTLELRYNVYKI